jgi:hypothetical protein
MKYLDLVINHGFHTAHSRYSSREVFVEFTIDKAELWKVLSRVGVTIDGVWIGE